MPQSIFIQVGQCGNQIGFSFWDACLKEYEQNKHFGWEYGALDHFFYNDGALFGSNERTSKSLNARAILIDMEETVIQEYMRGNNRGLFSRDQILTDVSGSGNNWAVGNQFYGQMYHERMFDMFQKEAERCSSLDSFLLAFSLGGGTGSGLGSAALEILHAEYPRVPKIAFAVFPSSIDDVITSPYNAMLANRLLIEKATCVIPFHNEVLSKICLSNSEKFIKPLYQAQNKDRAFQDMNYLITNTILDLTGPTRFSGQSNIDVLDIVTNLIIYPDLKFFNPVLAPLLSKEKLGIIQLFRGLYSGNNNLSDVVMHQGSLISALLVLRGDTDVGFEYPCFNMQNHFTCVLPYTMVRRGFSRAQPFERKRSVLMLGNSTHFGSSLEKLKMKFLKMYHRKAHLHHYTDLHSDICEEFEDAIEKTCNVIDEYQRIELDLAQEKEEQNKRRLVVI